MPRYQPTGNLRAWLVPTVSSIAAPTVAEITAGTDITSFMPRSGLSTPRSFNTTDTSSIQSLDDTAAVGTRGGDVFPLTFYRDNTGASDTAWNTILEDTAWYLVIRDAKSSAAGGSTAAVATSDKVRVYPVSVGAQQPTDPAADAEATFTASLVVTSVPNLHAVVA